MPTVQRGEVTIYYEEAGTGAPLLFICGISADLQIWRFQASELSRSYRVICFDNRGAGRPVHLMSPTQWREWPQMSSLCSTICKFRLLTFLAGVWAA
jgi:pimeloyl-ACP methyl ester carboxylesterase